VDYETRADADVYEAPDVSLIGSAESLTAGGATITDPTDPASQIG
jgi:hypothetical protein